MPDPIYAVGDIHGQTQHLDRALDLIAKDGGQDARIVFLGDLVDRGPDPSAVIERLMTGQAQGRPWHVVKGNHDRMFWRFVCNGEQHDSRIRTGIGWLHPDLGGPATLASYGVKDASDRPFSEVVEAARAAVPQAHLDFIENLPLWLEMGELLFVHAGLLPGIALNAQTEDDLIWIRAPFLTHTEPHPWLVVHGHTALQHPQHFGNRIDLDGGTGYGRTLHPAVFEGRDCWLLSDQGRVPLVAG